MKKVVVIGSGGAGKSTFSKRLGEATGLEVIHLDSHYWRPNWVKTPEDEWHATVKKLIAKDSWIMGGHGLSKWLMQVILDQPDLQGLRRWLLATRDAHGLYKQYGFDDLRFPERWMERTAHDAY